MDQPPADYDDGCDIGAVEFLTVGVDGPLGDLLMKAPIVEFKGGFYVAPDGVLSVISKDPTAEIPNP